MKDDPLLARAELAIEESCRLRKVRVAASRQLDQVSADLRRAVFESAMLRTEVKAHRDNSE